MLDMRVLVEQELLSVGGLSRWIKVFRLTSLFLLYSGARPLGFQQLASGALCTLIWLLYCQLVGLSASLRFSLLAQRAWGIQYASAFDSLFTSFSRQLYGYFQLYLLGDSSVVQALQCIWFANHLRFVVTKKLSNHALS